MLFNLKTTNYNGLKGVLLRFDNDNGRWVVQVERHERPKAFKSENLKSSDDYDYIVISSEDEDEEHDDNRRRRKKRRLNNIEATCEAWVDPSQTPETPGHVVSTSSEGTKTCVSQKIFEKLQKMLKLGLHPDTPLEEAQQAMKLANRALRKHNLTQEDILGTKRNDTKAVGGMVPVILRSIKSKKALVGIPRWADKMARAVSKLYGVKVFFRRGSGKVIFYGILLNSRLAAYAFSVGFHYIHVNMRRYIPSVDDYNSTSTITARNCYADGIAEGLENISKKEAADISSQEGGGRALILLNNQKQIALDVLRKNGLNLRKSRSRRERAGFARNAFLQGKEDAKNIDFRRRALH